MAVNSSQECGDAHSVAIFPDASVTTSNPLCEPQLPFLSVSNTSTMIKTQSGLDVPSNCQTHAPPKMNNPGIPSVLDVDIEKGKLETPKSSDGTIGTVKGDESLARALQREISVQIGGKFMQLLMNHSFELPKFTFRDNCMTERGYDTPNSRARKYKRSASFNSRRVVLYFSVLSSMGTIILIFLTLRVKQMADGSSSV